MKAFDGCRNMSRFIIETLATIHGQNNVSTKRVSSSTILHSCHENLSENIRRKRLLNNTTSLQKNARTNEYADEGVREVYFKH